MMASDTQSSAASPAEGSKPPPKSYPMKDSRSPAMPSPEEESKVPPKMAARPPPIFVTHPSPINTSRNSPSSSSRPSPVSHSSRRSPLSQLPPMSPLSRPNMDTPAGPMNNNLFNDYNTPAFHTDISISRQPGLRGGPYAIALTKIPPLRVPETPYV
ncbi:hypothetical protein F5B19DRAFT_503884 [Rostrohypoxylon terebratum]|nr:hypothetical protein F5B19DRAFT_503884 [Rostrohypoxylon terebratum]